MKYYSTRDRSPRSSFTEAVLNGLAPDGGLYLPESIPVLNRSVTDAGSDLPPEEIAFKILSPFIRDDFTSSEISTIAKRTTSFPIPAREVEPDIFAVELFHGPTFAFKDFAAGFMAAVMTAIVSKRGQELVILVATSGDTGGAVAAAFHNLPGIRVIILYPDGRVTPIQEKQLTTLGGNVRAISIAGSFDDCQALVKQAFSDQELRAVLPLTSANSINIARLLPQVIYYFLGLQQLPGEAIDLAVPSGNFGNLTAGIIAKRMGLRVRRLVAGMNANDVVLKYLDSGDFIPKPSLQTISNAMDVGDPSNFSRILELCHESHAEIAKTISGSSFSDQETKVEMQRVYSNTKYILDPHSAVGLLALRATPSLTKPAAFMATAHPGKFQDLVESTLNTKLTLPAELAAIIDRDSKVRTLPNDYTALRAELLACR